MNQSADRTSRHAFACDSFSWLIIDDLIPQPIPFEAGWRGSERDDGPVFGFVQVRGTPERPDLSA